MASISGDGRRPHLGRATAQIFLAQATAQAAGFAVAVVVARQLGAEAFGMYAFTLVVAVLLAQFPGAGLDMAAMPLGARYWPLDRKRAQSILSLSAALKLGLGVVVAGLGTVLADPIAQGVFQRGELATLIRVAVWWAIALALTDAMLVALQARERIRAIMAVQAAIAALRLLPVGLLAVAGSLTLGSALAIAVGAAVAGSLIAAAIAGTWRHRAWNTGHARELFAFSRWLLVATAIGIVIGNLDVVALTHFAGPEATGIYASGRTLAMPVAVAGAALGAVLLARFGGLVATSTPLPAAVRHVQTRTAVVVVAVAAAALTVGPPLLRLVFGPAYDGGIVVFQLLVVAYSLELVAWPTVAVLIVLGRPDIIMKVTFGTLLVSVVGYPLVVPAHGAAGAAFVFLAGRLLTAGPMIAAGHYVLRAPDAQLQKSAHVRSDVRSAAGVQ